MTQDQCISVTDLRTKTKECLADLSEEPKYIFMNNRPIAVLIDINQYEASFLTPELVELKEDKVSSKQKKSAMRMRKMKKTDLINI